MPGRKGEDDPLERWLADGYPAAYRTAFLILHDRHDAEEAVQEAFLRAWRFRDAIPPGAGLQPWLYRVVVNACLSRLRSDRTRKERTAPLDVAVTGGAGGRGGAGYGDPETSALARSERDAVLSALASLPEDLRVVVVLRYFAQLGEREIAQVIRRRPGTVKSRLHEARSRLARDPRLARESQVGSAVAERSGNA